MAKACKACASPSRGYIDGALRDGLPYNTIIAELASRGETFSSSNLTRHKPHMRQADEVRLDGELEATVQLLREERNRVAPTLRASYSILIAFLESVANRKVPTAREAIAAAESIARLGGMTNKQKFLLDFAEAAWAPGGAMTQPSVGATEDFPSIPEELQEVLPDE